MKHPFIRASRGGTSGSLRGALKPFGTTLGLASAVVVGGAWGEEPSPPPPESVVPSTAFAGEGLEEEEGEQLYTLPTVQVEDSRGSYRTAETSLQRLPTSIRNTPQQISVIPEQVIRDQRATTVQDTLRNISGITASAGEGGRQGDTFIIRGFSAQNDVFRDGVRDLGWFTRDTFNLENVEVYFGPSSVLFGRGSTGGTVNLVTKKPKRQAFYEAGLSGGTHPLGRLDFDVNQPVTDKIQVRLSGVGQLAGVAGRDEATRNRAGLSPSFRWDLGQRTSLELEYFYQHEDSVPDYGQPYFRGFPVSSTLGVPRSTFYGIRGSDRVLVNANVGTARLQHSLKEGFLLTNTLRIGGVDRFARTTAPRGLEPKDFPTTIGRQRFATSTDNYYLVDQLNLGIKVDTGILHHTANAGVELSRELRKQHRDSLDAVGLVTGPDLPADLFNPDPSPDLSAVQQALASATNTRQTVGALFLADQVGITKYFELLASVRFDLFKTALTTVDAVGTRTEVGQTDHIVNWRGGAVFHPLSYVSVYAMYGTSANPSAELGTLPDGTQTLKPERNHNLEFGAKADLLSNRLSVSGSVFRIDKDNARVPNALPEGAPQVLAGRQRVQGFNLGAAGSIVSRWNVFANVTFLDSEILKHSDPYLLGERLPNTPKLSFSLWTTYEPLRGLSLGGGPSFQSSATVNNPVPPGELNRVPAYWRWDAYAAYTYKLLSFQLNLYNLTNRLFYDQYYPFQAVPVESRTAMLTCRVRF